ncbi:MAG: HAD-IA family hydrolase [Ignavibacteria bacterium]|jgi:putative hydrolase of the HAD superfamily|nr:HAD-IA family hydrolase [Ignavibacteria bacterium]MCU7504398.1 HAD-IA family hydrolase [Ignavibacteria bacterium]MCU7518161.1 HAD-IA family hydrolase [Ignavibacteria bacterium]
MVKNLIFDLSEVIINGLLGVERELAVTLGLPEKEIINSFWGKEFEELLTGEIDEDFYIDNLIKSARWNISRAELKEAIRRNFHEEVEGVIPLINSLSQKYKLYLLSDHSKEWIEYIMTVHPFLNIFEKVSFSYEFRMMKKDPAVFPELLRRLDLKPEECLFIDDHQRNVDNARLAGIDGIRFLNAEQLKEDLLKKNVFC